MLDSQHANYSFGNLHKLMQFALSKVNFSSEDNILMLGLGAGSVPYILQKEYNFAGNLQVVEMDPEVVNIAYQHFNLARYSFLNIHTADARKFVTVDKHTYHLIIVDLFIDNKIPNAVLTLSFWQQIHRLLQPNGQVIFNAGFDLSAEQLKQFQHSLSGMFKLKVYSKVAQYNTLIICSKL